ncbi:MAG: HAMP domain-containing sensor histidine kinase [Melioribacteraceae bacterium]|nr:HAMP domain-containing sensor histidine kinase [Melioribacteraceae bacterium]
MRMSGGPASLNIKIMLLVLGIAIAGGTLYFTNDLVQKLQERERQIAELYANSLEYIADPNINSFDATFIFDNIVRRIDFPLILTDANDNVIFQGFDVGIRNLDIDTTLSGDELQLFLKQKVAELAEEHEPIEVTFDGTTVRQKIYFGDSELIKSLRLFPYLQISFALFFVLIAYFSFSYMKKTEQSNIWVGMAKETAHQLGTPISSLMGWNEMLKLHYNDPDKVLDTSDEIDNDLFRLNKVTNRFSKIGSKAELKEENLYEIITRIINYFHRRLPNTARNMKMEIDGPEDLIVKINIELFEWVLENLVKNALDAIDHKHGVIKFRYFLEDSKVYIEVSDNGKGIEYNRRKDIFRPGYSTKRRGWGLGLSLSKRIIENYHEGRIFVKESVPGEGTTFRIILKK